MLNINPLAYIHYIHTYISAFIYMRRLLPKVTKGLAEDATNKSKLKMFQCM